ncbi:hypothetical protein PCAR4_570307 [Paraburkholderia caribensis]|nr:hypothetical protein PCAR4_570307 [Paraburkholderia caribensis]
MAIPNGKKTYASGSNNHASVKADLRACYPQFLLKDLWKSAGLARYLSDQSGFLRP